MVKLAEENLSIDQSKKALIQIAFDFDNLVLKIENILKKDNSSAILCKIKNHFISLKQTYKQNRFTNLHKVNLNELKSIIFLLLLC